MNRLLSHIVLVAGLVLPSSIALGQPSGKSAPVTGGVQQSGRNNGVKPLPIATTNSAIGSEDAPTMIRLGGKCGDLPLSAMEMIISKLPTHGVLMQNDGIRITAVPTKVSDPGKSVWFVPFANENGSPLASFNYKVRLRVDGRESAPAEVKLEVLPVPDVPVGGWKINMPMYEDAPVIFQLPASDVDLDHEGDELVTAIDTTINPIFGKLYQVGSDGTSMGELIAGGSVVTNPDRLVMYVPNGNYWGNSPNFVYSLEDSYGLKTNMIVTLNLLPINDAPHACDARMGLSNLYPYGWVPFIVYDVDMPYDELTVTIHELPTKGELYRGQIAPENLISEPGTSFSWTEGIQYVQTEPGLGENFDHFTYSASDREYESEIANISVDVIYQNLAAVIDQVPPVTIDEDSGITEFALDGSDPDGPHEKLQMYVYSLPKHGSLWVQNVIYTTWVPVIVPNTLMGYYGGPWKVKYVPNPGENTFGEEADSFVINLTDAYTYGSSEGFAKIEVTINPVNDAPVITGASTANAHITVPWGQHIKAVIDDLVITDDSKDSIYEALLMPSEGLGLNMVTFEGLMEYGVGSDGSIYIAGTMEQINAVLAAGVEVDPSSYGVGVVTLTVNDNGCDGDNTNQASSHQTYVIVTP